MRVLTICHEYPPVGGGGATACEVLAEALVKAGHDVDVVTAAMRGDPPLEVRRGVHVHRALQWRRRPFYSTTAELATWIVPALALARRLVRTRPYDVVHCHFIVPGGVVAVPLASRLALPLILTAHGSDVPGYNPDRFSLTHRLIAPVWSRIVRAGTAVTVSSIHLAGLLAGSSGRQPEIIPYACQPQPVPPVEARAERLLVAARLVERKGVHTLLAALEGEATGYQIVIAGDGPCLEPLRAMAQSLAIPATFLGFVPRAPS
jgi:glycosyltransferase involved in cell wall biosynthesis